MRDIIVLPDRYKVIICDNKYHECYGRRVEISEGKWRNHDVHIEHVEDDWFNFSVNNRMFMNKTFAEMKAYMERL